MDFRSLLLGLEGSNSSLELVYQAFDSQVVASPFHMPVKHASNDLRRLYRMGFLRRTKVKRRCLPLGGKPCNKGFMYRYHLSKQGFKYAEWLRKGRIADNLAYVKLTDEVLSYLPDELKNRLSTLSLYRSAKKCTGPRRSLNLLENNAVPVICLSIAKSELLGEKEKLELKNLAEKIGRERDLTSYQEQITGLVVALAYVVALAGANKNSAESWRTTCIESWKGLAMASGGLPADSMPFNKDIASKAPLLDSHRRSSHTRIEMPRVFPWKEYCGKTGTLTQQTWDRSGHLQYTFKITPESAKTLMESI